MMGIAEQELTATDRSRAAIQAIFQDSKNGPDYSPVWKGSPPERRAAILAAAGIINLLNPADGYGALVSRTWSDFTATQQQRIATTVQNMSIWAKEMRLQVEGVAA